jgi:all-trans-8'-apo-beta-carotenal 15,15'-oxygenase
MLAFDEMQAPYELNPHSLDTVGVINLDPEKPKAVYQAHWKVDPKRNELLLFGIQPGPTPIFNVTVFDTKYQVKKRYQIKMPGGGYGQYIHDWSFTDDYFVFILHPVYIPIWEMGKTLIGMQPIADALRFNREKGNLVWVVPRDTSIKPKGFQAEGRWVWHTANAYQKEGKILVDFIGSDKFYGITETDSVFSALMKGENPPVAPTNSLYRRYQIDFTEAQLKEEAYLSYGDGEFPQINPVLSCSEHRYSYYIEHRAGRISFNHLIQLDLKKEHSQEYDFGRNEFVGEPTLIPNRFGKTGWVTVPVYDSVSKKGQLAIFEEENIAKGPIGIIYLKSHIPFTLHGRFTHE